MGSLDAPRAVGAELVEPVEFAKEEDVILYVNGKCHVLPPNVAHQTLLEYLRGAHFSHRCIEFSLLACLRPSFLKLWISLFS